MVTRNLPRCSGSSWSVTLLAPRPLVRDSICRATCRTTSAGEASAGGEVTACPRLVVCAASTPCEWGNGASVDSEGAGLRSTAGPVERFACGREPSTATFPLRSTSLLLPCGEDTASPVGVGAVPEGGGTSGDMAPVGTVCRVDASPSTVEGATGSPAAMRFFGRVGSDKEVANRDDASTGCPVSCCGAATSAGARFAERVGSRDGVATRDGAGAGCPASCRWEETSAGARFAGRVGSRDGEASADGAGTGGSVAGGGAGSASGAVACQVRRGAFALSFAGKAECVRTRAATPLVTVCDPAEGSVAPAIGDGSSAVPISAWGLGSPATPATAPGNGAGTVVGVAAMMPGKPSIASWRLTSSAVSRSAGAVDGGVSRGGNAGCSSPTGAIWFSAAVSNWANRAADVVSPAGFTRRHPSIPTAGHGLLASAGIPWGTLSPPFWYGFSGAKPVILSAEGRANLRVVREKPS